VNPDLLIAIDALAARRSSRINAAIQLSNTGIAPGAGVGNKRMMLDQDSLGIPVIAIGVPTVVDAATLVNDTMDCILNEMMTQTENGSDFYKTLQSLEQEEKYQMITNILGPYTGNMFVTPKEVDAVIDRLANIIANSINIALHPGVTMEDINKYTW
jgi:spore protease